MFLVHVGGYNIHWITLFINSVSPSSSTRWAKIFPLVSGKGMHQVHTKYVFLHTPSKGS